MAQMVGLDPIPQAPHVPIGQRMIEMQNLTNQQTLDQQKIAENRLTLQQKQDAERQSAGLDAVVAKGGKREDMMAGASSVGAGAAKQLQDMFSKMDTDALNQTNLQLKNSNEHITSMKSFMDAIRGKEKDPNTPLIYKHFKDSLLASGDTLAKTLPDQYDPNYLAQYDDAGKTVKLASDIAEQETKKREDTAKAAEESQKLINDKLTAKETQSKIDNAGMTPDLQEFNKTNYFQTFLRDHKIDPSTLNKSTEEQYRGQAFIEFKQAQLKDSNPTEWSLALEASKGDPAKALHIVNDAKMQGVDLSPEALDMVALKFAKSGDLVALGMGNASAATRREILNRAAKLYPGIDVAANQADYITNRDSLKKLQSSQDQVIAFENTANKNLDQFLGTTKGVVDSNSPWVNKAWRSVMQSGAGDVDLAKFNAARQVAINEIAKVTSNPGLSGQLSDTARKEVEAFIPADATLKQVYGVAAILKADMKNRHDANDDQIKAIQVRISKPPAGATTTPATIPAATTTPKIIHYDNKGNRIP